MENCFMFFFGAQVTQFNEEEKLIHARKKYYFCMCPYIQINFVENFMVKYYEKVKEYHYY